MTTTPNADALSALLSETLKEDVKRYTRSEVISYGGVGPYMYAADVDAILSENAALVDANVYLAAENERLRSAIAGAAGGDALNDMNGKHAVDGISALLKDAEPLHRDAFEHLEPVPHIATLINNNQFGWTNIIETAPNVTIDVGTKLYDQKALFAVGVAMLEQGRKVGFEDGYIAGKAYQKHFASAPPPSAIHSSSTGADATLRAALEKYGWHNHRCAALSEYSADVRDPNTACTCGFDAARAGNEGEK